MSYFPTRFFHLLSGIVLLLGLLFSSFEQSQAQTNLAITALDANRDEGNAGNTAFTFRITRTGVLTGASGVDWAVTGSGANPANAADFGGTFPNGTANFAATEAQVDITIQVSGDLLIELNEDFTVTLSNPTGATITTATAIGTIINDDTFPTMSIAATDANKAEGNPGPDTPFTFTITRVGNLGNPSSVTYTVAGVAPNPADNLDIDGPALPFNQTVNFAVNQATQVITVNINGDNDIEPNETFTVTLSGLVGALAGTLVATGTIQNDDSAPNLAIAATDAAKPEGNTGTTNFTFTVTRTGNLGVASAVNWAVTGSGANPANANDFTGTAFPAGVLNFAVNETTEVITIPVNGDTEVELNEDFVVTLSNPTNAGLGTATATGTIQNDDSPPPSVVFLVAEGVSVGGQGSGSAELLVSGQQSVIFVALPLPNSSGDTDRRYRFYVNDVLQSPAEGSLSNVFVFQNPQNDDRINVEIFDRTDANGNNPPPPVETPIGVTDYIIMKREICEGDAITRVNIPGTIINSIANDPWYKILGLRYQFNQTFLEPIVRSPTLPGLDVSRIYDATQAPNFTPANLDVCYGSVIQRRNTVIPFDPNNPSGPYNLADYHTLNTNYVPFNPCEGFNFDPAIITTAGTNNITLQVFVEDAFPDNGNFDFNWFQTFTISVVPRPTPNIIGPAVFCAEDTEGNYQTAFNTNSQYIWEFLPEGGGAAVPILQGPGLNQLNNYNVPGSGRIRVTEINGSGCQNTDEIDIVVNLLPNPQIANQNFAVCQPLTPTSFEYRVENPEPGVLYLWTVVGGTFTSSSISPVVFVDWGGIPGNASIEVRAVNFFTGCEQTVTQSIVVNPLPAANFTFESACNINPLAVRFDGRSSSIANPGVIANWQWNFAGGTLSSEAAGDAVVVIQFDNPGLKSVEMVVESNAGCLDTLRLDLFLGTDGWIATGFTLDDGLSGCNNDPAIPFSWRFEVPQGATIANPDPVWITSNANLTYNCSERSYVESPCFDLANLPFPMAVTDIWPDTDPGTDGVILAARVEAPGQDWQIVGQLGQGANWYNNQFILGQIGGIYNNTTGIGWSGNFTDWSTARLGLDNLRSTLLNAGAQFVRFRMALASNGDNPIAATLDGFGFRNFRLLQRNRFVLVEHFTNTLSPANITEETFLNTTVDPNNDANQRTLLMRYLVNFPVNEPLLLTQQNKADNSARALYYQVSDLNRTVIDGIISNPVGPAPERLPQAFSSGWGVLEHSRRLLAEPNVNISDPVVSQESVSSMRFSFQIEQAPLSNPIGTALVQICLVDKSSLPYNNLVRGFFPNTAPAGDRRLTWDELATPRSFDLVWQPPQDISPNDFLLVVFLQDEQTREVYQVASANIPFSLDVPGGRESTGTSPAAAEPGHTFRLYPNPASSDCQIWFSQITREALPWQVRNSRGETIASGIVPPQTPGFLLRTQDWAEGFYTLTIGTQTEKLVLQR
ncbi:MAG: hypothetical protein HC913_17320 [Microscillaceae bacterium]|nr:hypothetical protein [Microscillaceae bacterium]